MTLLEGHVLKRVKDNNKRTWKKTTQKIKVLFLVSYILELVEDTTWEVELVYRKPET